MAACRDGGRRRGRISRWVLLLLLILLFGGGPVWWMFFRDRSLLTLQGHTDAVWGVAFAADGTRIASASGDQTVKVWDAQTGKEQFSLQGHVNQVRCVVFSADGRRLASGSDDHTVRLWDAQTGQL